MPKKNLLTSNSDLRRDGIWTWTLPAWVTKLPDGRVVNVCPSAGACKNLCYARNGTYLFRNVREAHQRNLALTLDHLEEWRDQMISELSRKKFRPSGEPRFADDRDRLILDDWTGRWLDQGGAAVRVHDSGDFYSDEYLDAWIEIARSVPDVLFYAYTKEVPRVKDRARAGDFPTNFRIILSLGGIHDHMIDGEEDRHAEVFPDLVSLADAGYQDQSVSDLYAVLLDTTRVGIPANNIRHFQKRQGDRTFGQIERDMGRRRTAA